MKREPDHFVVFDTEDDSRERMERTGCGFDKEVTQIAARSSLRGDFYSDGPDVVPFLQWLQKGPEAFYYAHNTQYDLGNLFGRQLDKLDVTLVGGRLIKARHDGAEYRDNFNLWPMSLKRVGKAFGLAKGKLNERDPAYVWGDVNILDRAVRFFHDFCRREDLGRVPTTLGGLAVRVWQRTQASAQTCHHASLLSRAALFGGRVELFKRHSETRRVIYTDINSLYPHCMTEAFPGPLAPTRSLPAWGIVDATVRVPRCSIPILPVRRADGAVLFACGRFRGAWTAEELRFAMGHGTKVERVHEALGAEQTVCPYGEFVQECFGLRLDAKTEAESLLWKLVLNNLYGRLASTGLITRSVKLTARNKHDGHPFGSKTLMNYAMPLQAFVNWSHAAYVTARGRIALWKFLDSIGAGNLIYCDTDSAIFDWPKDKALPFDTGKGLGQMKLVAEREACATYAPKAYKFGRVSKAKGVPTKFARRYLQRGTATFELPFRMREAILFFDRDNERQLSVWHKITRHRAGTYDKKKLRGNRYEPLLLSPK